MIMTDTLEISVTKVKQSKLLNLSLDNISFGKYFSDHMLEADFINGEWTNVAIKPYQPLLLEPSNAALHYGQSIFEGIKAYRLQNGGSAIFRPYENLNRFNISAERMQMPAVPEEIFIDGMKQLIAIDNNWIPNKPEHSLYIRPFMFATDPVIGVKPSETYKFLIILSPTGPYFAEPMRIYCEEKYTRAAPGGTGFAKCAGNYAGSLKAMAEAKKNGYDQILWMDVNEHKYVQEIGVMNFFCIIGNSVITPNIGDTILDGITRKSAITLFSEMGFEIEERPLGIDEIINAYKAGTLREAFGAGTAATIALIKELRYQDFVMEFDTTKLTIAPEMKKRMDAIKNGTAEDRFDWLVKL